MISRVCEEFGCLPSEAIEEDAELVLSIMSLRNFARSKAAVEAIKDEYDPSTERQKELVMEVHKWLIEEDRAGDGDK